jgi:hypothetical protein
MTTNFFLHPSLLLRFLDPGSGIRDPGSGMGKKSGYGIRDKHPGSATLLSPEFRKFNRPPTRVILLPEYEEGVY